MAYDPNDESRIEGRNAVLEALKAGRAIDKVYIARDDGDRALGFIAAKARAAGAAVSTVDRRKLDFMSSTHAHQGVIAVAAAREYSTVADILALAEERGEAPLIIICDEITDPHNLGAIIRTAEVAGAHGVIIPRHRSSGVTALVIGSEGEGMGRLVSEKCDFLVSIPMFGKVNSLNASAAAAVVMFEAVRQRHSR